jgi:uncharacterized protein (TIGR03643 family)
MSSKRQSKAPVTRVMRPLEDDDRIERLVRLAWADRVTFEDIEAQTGLSEPEVIRFMRRHQSPATFKRWRQRAGGRSTKHRARFEMNRPRRGRLTSAETHDGEF